MLGIVNGEIVKVTDKNVQKEIDINTEVLGIVNGEIVKVTDESVQKEIDINTEVLGIVNGEIVKVTDDNVQKEIDINTEVLGIVNSVIVKVTDISFSDNTRVRIFIFLSRKAQFFFPEFNIRLYDKNSESDYFFFSTKIRIFFSATLGIRIFA